MLAAIAAAQAAKAAAPAPAVEEDSLAPFAHIGGAASVPDVKVARPATEEPRARPSGPASRFEADPAPRNSPPRNRRGSMQEMCRKTLVSFRVQSVDCGP